MEQAKLHAHALRNVGKGASTSFTKAYTHNGWFKSLKSLVHFYNTRDTLPKCETLPIVNATEKEALANNCWPAPEFPNPAFDGIITQGPDFIGNLGLTFEPYATSEEAALVAYMQALTDTITPRKP